MIYQFPTYKMVVPALIILFNKLNVIFSIFLFSFASFLFHFQIAAELIFENETDQDSVGGFCEEDGQLNYGKFGRWSLPSLESYGWRRFSL